MKLLVITPDYASHYLPLAAVATAWRKAGGRSIIACGPGLEPRVRDDGFEHIELILGPGNNPGLLRTDRQPESEGEHLQRFFEATRGGMAETLRYQAEARRHDLLWRPRKVAERLAAVAAEVRPDAVLSDQISFSATVGLRALGTPYAAFVTGHPTSLPLGDDLYGYPHLRPPEFDCSTTEMDRLRELCRRVRRQFTAEFNLALTGLAPDATPVEDAFAATSPWLTLFNYPGELVRDRRRLLPETAHFLGSAVRREELDPQLAEWFAQGDGRAPTIYVSFGSFLSAREDALGRIVEALRMRPWRVVLATGVADTSKWGALPSDWLVRAYLPQVAVLEHCDLVITHGGNNTVTESLDNGLPLVVAPFSTDQFAGAESLRRAGLGRVIDPNRSTPADIADAVEQALTRPCRDRASRFGAELRRDPGPERAVRLLRQLPTLSNSSRQSPRRAGLRKVIESQRSTSADNSGAVRERADRDRPGRGRAS